MKLIIKMPKIARVITVVILSIIAFLSLVVFGVRAYFMAPINDYYLASAKEFKIPGLGDNFVPQGFAYDANQNRYLISGYFSNKTASAVYFVDGTSGQAKQVRLAYKDGSPMKRHSGGVAFYSDFVYVAGSSANCVYVYSYSAMLAVNDGQKVNALGEFSLVNPEDENDYITASALSIDGNRLVINEFHYEPNYSLLDSHEMTTKAGDKHGGYAIAFYFSQNEEFGLSKTPVCAYTIRDKVQGMAFHDGKIYCSTSYSLANSVIYEYDRTKMKEESKIKLLGKEISLYAIDSSIFTKSYTLPPMAEGIVFKDNKLLTMSEFACNKYILGKFTSAKWCYATDLKLL
ncbi:MAG: hypothetical protein E7360_05180 [Clostridiales bacterium]|nr:hypothetical protein [Clostridiales bacterium]